MRLLLRRLLSLMLVVSLLPGVPEALEAAEHVVHELAEHTEAHAEALEDEHGCTPMAHHCGCHASSVGVLPAGEPDTERPVSVVEERPVAAGQRFPRRWRRPHPPALPSPENEEARIHPGFLLLEA